MFDNNFACPPKDAAYRDLVQQCTERFKGQGLCSGKGVNKKYLRDLLCDEESSDFSHRASSERGSVEKPSVTDSELRDMRQKRAETKQSSWDNERFEENMGKMLKDVEDMINSVLSAGAGVKPASRIAMQSILFRNRDRIQPKVISHTEFDYSYTKEYTELISRKPSTKHMYSNCDNMDDVQAAIGILTKLVVPKFMPSAEHRIRFIDMVSRTYNLLCDIVYEKYKVNYHIFLKGGNVFRIMLRTFSDDMRRAAARDISDLTRDISDMSDLDFEMFPDMNDYAAASEREIERFKHNIKETEQMVQYLSFLTTMRMRDFIVSNVPCLMPGILRLRTPMPQLNGYKDTLVREVQTHFDELESGHYMGHREGARQGGIKVFSIAYAHEHIDAYDDDGHEIRETSFNTKGGRRLEHMYRNDFVIKTEGASSYVYKTYDVLNAEDRSTFESFLTPSISTRAVRRKLRRAFYCTHNCQIETPLSYFQLNRIRVTLLIAYEKNGQRYIDALPAELLDLSHGYLMNKGEINEETRAKFQHPEYLVNYRLSTPTTRANVLSFTPIGLISDFMRILFSGPNDMPWTNCKYKKRIRRLFWTVALDVLSGEHDDAKYSEHVASLVSLRDAIEARDMYLIPSALPSLKMVKSAYLRMFEKYETDYFSEINQVCDITVTVIDRVIHVLKKNRRQSISPQYHIEYQHLDDSSLRLGVD